MHQLLLNPDKKVASRMTNILELDLAKKRNGVSCSGLAVVGRLMKAGFPTIDR